LLTVGFSTPNSQAHDDLKNEFIVATWHHCPLIINAFHLVGYDTRVCT
jgi:hypothetical protein